MSTHAPITGKQRWLGPLWLALALVPAAVVVVGAPKAEELSAGERRRAAVLAKIPTDEAVLINVTMRDMPASPDILDLGKRSTKALERCLADNVDSSIRADCAVVLEALGDKHALPTLHTALEDWEPSVRYRVVRALGAMPDKSSVGPLAKLFRRPDEQSYVRRAALQALGTISDKAVVQLMRAELNKKPEKGKPDFRPDAFEALWNNRHLMAGATLIGDTRAALKSDSDSLVLAATLASAEVGSPRLVAALVPLMGHPWAEVRNKAVYALGRIGDKTATKALLAKLPEVRDARMLNNIAFALERLDRKAFYASIKQVVEHKQAIIRLNAAFVLGDVRHAEGLPLLQKALGDASDYVRTSAIVAVGKLGTTNTAQTTVAIKAIEPFVEHANLSVRQEAVYAMHQLTKGGRADLVHDKLFAKLTDRRQRAARERAAITLGKAGDTRVRGYLLGCLLSHGCDIDEVAGFFTRHATSSDKGRMLLGWARGNLWLDDLVAALKPAGGVPIAKSALEAAWSRSRSYSNTSAMLLLGSFGDASAIPLLRRRATTQHTGTRILANVALSRLGDEAAVNKVVAELDNLPAEYLDDFAWAVSAVTEAVAREALQKQLEPKQKHADARVALAAAAVLLAWSPDKAFFRFLDGLASNDAFERNLAARYLARNDDKRVTWLMRRALSREGRDAVKERLRSLLDGRSQRQP